MKAVSELVINFGGSGNSLSYLGGGWARPEDKFTWAVGQESHLILPLGRDAMEFVLTMNVIPFVHPPALPAQRFGLQERGMIRRGYHADLVLFDPENIVDTATYSDPIHPAAGIERVWVNGVLSYTSRGATGNRGGRFLPRGKTTWIQ